MKELTGRSAMKSPGKPAHRRDVSWRTHLRSVSDGTPRSRATWAIGRPDSTTRRAPRSSNSGGYFLGRDIDVKPASPQGRNPGIEASVKPSVPHLTVQSLRRTCASLIVALGWDPARFARFLGHSTGAFTLSAYAQAMDWADGEAERLRTLWEGTLDAEDGQALATVAA
jgi:integrase